MRILLHVPAAFITYRFKSYFSDFAVMLISISSAYGNAARIALLRKGLIIGVISHIALHASASQSLVLLEASKIVSHEDPESPEIPHYGFLFLLLISPFQLVAFAAPFFFLAFAFFLSRFLNSVNPFLHTSVYFV